MFNSISLHPKITSIYHCFQKGGLQDQSHIAFAGTNDQNVNAYNVQGPMS